MDTHSLLGIFSGNSIFFLLADTLSSQQKIRGLVYPLSPMAICFLLLLTQTLVILLKPSAPLQQFWDFSFYLGLYTTTQQPDTYRIFSLDSKCSELLIVVFIPKMCFSCRISWGIIVGTLLFIRLHYFKYYHSHTSTALPNERQVQELKTTSLGYQYELYAIVDKTPINSLKVQMSIPFISVINGKFQLNPQAKQHLSSLDTSTPIGVISVLGKYRTGKSFLLNNVIIASGQQVFKVGPTVNSCTKGIWIAKDLVNPINSSSSKVIVLDVEGFGIVDEIKTDSRIFLFPLLLSSYLIYNSVGNITEEALRTLGLIVGLAREVQLKSQKDEECSYFPAFHWILRDFSLQLEDSFGNKMSTKQYLDKALEQQKGLSQAIEQKNRIRRNFREFFKERDCSTLIKPTNSDQDTDTARQFRPQFREEAQKLRNKILSNIQPKSISKSTMTIPTFIELAETLVIILNEGAIPNVQNVWRNLYVSREKQMMSKIRQTTIKKIGDGELAGQRQNIPQKVKQFIEKQFRKQSFCQENPLPQISNLMSETISQAIQFADQTIKQKIEQQAHSLIIDLFNEIQQKVVDCKFKSILQLKQYVSQVKFQNTMLFSRLSLDKQQHIESQLMLKSYQCISTKLEIELEVTKSQKLSFQQQVQQQKYVIDGKDKEIRGLNSKLTEAQQNNWTMNSQIQKIRADLIRKQQQCLSIKCLNNSQQQMLSNYQRQLHLNDTTNQYHQIVKQITDIQQQLLRTIDCRDKLSLQLSKSKEQSTRLNSDVIRLSTETEKLKDTIHRLNAEKNQRENRIAETERKIVQHIETEEIRIREIIKAGETREKEKDLIIQKLQRILRESKARKSEESNVRSSCHSSMLRMKQELHDRCNEKQILSKQVQMLKRQLQSRNLEILQLKKEHLSISKINNQKARSSMNVQLTSKGFEVKSFVSPSHKRDKQNHKLHIDNQLTVQAQLITQNQKLISNLISREKILQQQTSSLREIINRLQERITLVGRFYCLRCCKNFEERLIDHECQNLCKSQLCKSQKSILKDTEDWLSMSNSNIVLAVPVYYITEAADGKSSTVYQIELRTSTDQKWIVKRKYKDICELKKQLVELYPLAKDVKLYKSTKHDERRKFVEDFLRQALKVPQYRASQLFKRFLCDTDYISENPVIERVASLDAREIENIVQQSCRRLTTDKSARFSSGLPSVLDRMPKTTKSKRQPLQILEGFQLHI